VCFTQFEAVRNIIISGYADPVLTAINRVRMLVFSREESKKLSANVCSSNVYCVL
jgi:hypothetical protein